MVPALFAGRLYGKTDARREYSLCTGTERAQSVSGRHMINRHPSPPPVPLRRDAAIMTVNASAAYTDPIALALSRAYAATLAEPLPPALSDLLRALE